jgi:hypothetical protein
VKSAVEVSPGLWRSTHSSSIFAPKQSTRLIVQGRWWCDRCRKLYTGCVEVSDFNAEVSEIRHTCGAVMIRTPGDERFYDA